MDAIPNTKEKDGDIVGAKKILSAFGLTFLMIVLILIVSSRDQEKTPWGGNPSGSEVTVGRPGQYGPQVDNNVDNITDIDTSPTPEPTPKPSIYKPDIDINSWEYMLVNADNNIGRYVPPQTVAIADLAQYFDSRAVDALLEFLDGARAAGYSPYIMTAYRPYSAQEYLFNGKASQISWGGEYTYAEAVEMAKEIVAYPGSSEHQTGLCADITDKYYNRLVAEDMDQNFIAWMQEHCVDYGFILRYPDNKVGITGWDEPWHYRYVGKEVAQYMTENNLTLEEFRELYL